jgi:hypothetical protein
MEHDHGISAPDRAVWLEASALGEAAYHSLRAYPLASIAHVPAIAPLVDAIVSFDLRVLGVARAIRSRRLPGCCCRSRASASRWSCSPAW